MPTLDAASYPSLGTSLVPTAVELQQSTTLLIALTDAEGLEQLEQAGLRVEPVARSGEAILLEAWQAR